MVVVTISIVTTKTWYVATTITGVAITSDTVTTTILVRL